MRHERYFKEKNSVGKKPEAAPGSFETYEDFNSEEVKELIEKGRREAEELAKRQKARIKELEDLKKSETPHIKK